MQYYDMHSHILPDFDDGAKNIDDALELINCLSAQNVKNICLTPHFYTNEMSSEVFLQKREAAYQAFLPYIPKDINVVLGAEVYVTKYLFNNEDLSGLTYGKSRVMLTEFPYSSSFSGKSYNQLSELMSKYKVVPVIPHIERYDALMNDEGLVRELKYMGVITQSNASNYTKKASIFRRRKLLKYVQAGLIDIIGTDAHSKVHNTPENYAAAVSMISDKCGEAALTRMMSTAQKIFNSAVG